MPPKEPTRHQLSSRLQYTQKTPAFLQRLQRQITGASADNDNDGDDDNYYDDGSGRPPIPTRPPIPERPIDAPGSSDEGDEDDKPQVIVLKEGKHFTGWEAENERRKGKGLIPLPLLGKKLSDLAKASSQQENDSNERISSLSFSSTKVESKISAGKRKAVGNLDGGNENEGAKKTAKRVKDRNLLSFGDGDDA